ncbi:hypothetical protein ACWGB8_29025 [Kitasatospora sp. NPDC054939]
MHRTTALAAAAAAIALTALTGCNGDGAGSAASTASPSPVASTAGPSVTATATTTAEPTATTASSPTATAVPGAFDPAEALAAERAPYSALMTAITEVADTETLTMTGRINLGGAFTGRIELRTGDAIPEGQRIHMESVMTETSLYSRDLSKPGSSWIKVPKSADNDQADYAKYAKLLLATGPAARKGMEDVDGTPAYHLAARVELDQIAGIDPRTHRSMQGKGVTVFDCEQWIDSQGRTLRFEQRMTMRGVQGENTVTFTEFGKPVPVTAPAKG